MMRLTFGIVVKSIEYDPEEPGILKALAYDLLKASVYVLVGRSSVEIRRQAYEMEVTPAPWFFKPFTLFFLPSIIIHELLHVVGLALYHLIGTRCITTMLLLPMITQGILFFLALLIVEDYPFIALILLMASAVFPCSLEGDLMEYLKLRKGKEGYPA